MEKSRQTPSARRIVGMVVGIVIIGLGIALFKQSHLGNDSISALNMRLAEMLGISLGVQNLCTVVYAAIFVKDVKAAVQRGLGVAVISALAVQEELAAGKLLSFDLDRSGVFRRIYLAWPTGCPLTAAERRFADYVLSHAEQSNTG